MAKAKSRRFKYHLAAKKRQDEKSATAIGKQNVSGDINEINAGQGQRSQSLDSAPQQPMFNPFAGLKIDPASLNVNLNVPPPEEWDRKTVVSIYKEVTKGKNKKEKAKVKKELILKKLQAARQFEIDLKERKKREETVITKDLKPLLDSLPSVDLMFHEASEKATETHASRKSGQNKVKKDRNGMKAKQKHKEMMKDIAIFKSVLADSHFKENPTETILNHVTFAVQKEHLELRKAKKEAVNFVR